MRYPRNAKIFRGQMDFAPIAGVLFLLLIFLLLGSMMSPPGIPIQLVGNAVVSETESNRLLTVTRSGEVIFNGTTNKVDDLDRVREAVKKFPAGQKLLLRMEPGAPRNLEARLRQSFDSIELPVTTNYSRTLNPTLVVAINLGGQIFFENELVQPEQLKEKLQQAIGKSQEAFTLVVLADKSTTHDVTVRLEQIAVDAGIKEMLLVTQPAEARAKKL